MPLHAPGFAPLFLDELPRLLLVLRSWGFCAITDFVDLRIRILRFFRRLDLQFFLVSLDLLDMGNVV